jgi:hypothetical protein
MSSDFDASDFVDTEFQAARKSGYGYGAAAAAPAPAAEQTRPLSREEVETRVSETQVKLAELKRAQEELERERAALEELRRRQIEYKTGREEMLRELTRGVGLLEEAEFNARRDSEQMAKTITDFRSALEQVQILNEEGWSKENYNVELTRALTTLENARMEWNSARTKFDVLNGKNGAAPEPMEPAPSLAEMDPLQLCKLGLALTWPLVLVGFAIAVALFLRR